MDLDLQLLPGWSAGSAESAAAAWQIAVTTAAGVALLAAIDPEQLRRALRTVRIGLRRYR